MALIAPGPLATAIAGTVGGTVFKRTPHGARAQSWRKPRVPISSARHNQQTLLSRAALAWTTLAAADRASWAAAAETSIRSSPLAIPFTLTGQQLYTAAFSKQAALPTFTTPSPTQAIGQPAPISLTAALDIDYLRLTTISRPLEADETLTLHVLDTARQSRAWPRATLNNITWTNGAAGLGPTRHFSQAFDGTTASTNQSGTLFVMAQWTWELWIYPQTPQITNNQWVFVLNNGLGRLGWNCPGFFAGDIIYFDSPNTWSLGTTPSSNTWHYIAAVFDATANTIQLYLDGATFGPPAPFSPNGNLFTCTLGSTNGAFGRFRGRIDNSRISNIALSPAQILANYNSGKGALLTTNANAFALWPMSTIVGGKILDASGHGHDLTVNNTTPTFSSIDTPLLLPSATPLTSARRTWVRTGAFSPSTWSTKSTTVPVDW